MIRHGVAAGPWTEREDWINVQITRAWTDRGAFPGTGSVLEALGLRLGTSLLLELARKRDLRPGQDPWPLRMSGASSSSKIHISLHPSGLADSGRVDLPTVNSGQRQRGWLHGGTQRHPLATQSTVR